MTRVLLGDVCAQSREQVRPGERADLRYIGLESVESGTGNFVLGELSKTPEDPRAASFRFDARHVLYGKLRPYLNKVATPDFEGKCSTELVPLLPKESLNRHYLAYFLRSKSTVDAVVARTAGARMPRADMNHLLGFEIPLPSLPGQHHIVDLLSRAEGIIRLRREAQRKAAELTPTLFRHMFGDSLVNPKGWPVVQIGDLFDVKGGKRLPKGAPYSEEPTKHPYIRGTDISPNSIDRNSLVFLLPGVQQTIRRYVVEADDVVITIAGKIGVAAPVDESLSGANLTENAAMIRARGKSLTTAIYLSNAINSSFVQQQIDSLIGRVTIGKLALERIKILQISVPPLALQHAFATQAKAVQSIVKQQADALAKAQATFDALLSRAFQH